MKNKKKNKISKKNYFHKPSSLVFTILVYFSKNATVFHCLVSGFFTFICVEKSAVNKVQTLFGELNSNTIATNKHQLFRSFCCYQCWTGSRPLDQDRRSLGDPDP